MDAALILGAAFAGYFTVAGIMLGLIATLRGAEGVHTGDWVVALLWPAGAPFAASAVLVHLLGQLWLDRKGKK